MKAKLNLRNIFHYIIGNYRYKIYYSNSLHWLMRSHIREQIDFRIEKMDAVCFNTGSCTLCGCMTTALQMANKACDKPCYPTMMNSKKWREFYKYGKMNVDTSAKRIWSYKDKELKIFYEL